MTEKLLLIDGEIGTQLLKYEEEAQDDPLWSSRFNITAPDSVYKCYLDFLETGCDLIRTNTYQSSVAGLKEHYKLSQEEIEELFGKIIRQAHRAKEEFTKRTGTTRKIEVWASAGSYGAYLHDGSEYNGSFLDSTPKEWIRDFHRERLEILMKNELDGVAVETIPSVEEAKVVVGLFNEFYPRMKYWISLNCKDDQSTARGEPFGEAAKTIWELAEGKSQLFGVGVNCLDPKLVTPLFKTVNNSARQDPIPLIAYPNSGEKFDLEKRTWVPMPDCQPLSVYVPEWRQLGLVAIGGCCRNGSREIRDLRQYLDSVQL